MGGGGDVVGALAIARACESLGTPARLGGVAWERFPIDPHPGPRRLDEIRGGRVVGAAVLADAATTTPEGARFAESGMAEHLGEETVLIDVAGGVASAAAGMEAAAAELDCDLVILADVGGDVLATGTSPAWRARCATRSCSPRRPGCPPESRACSQSPAPAATAS